jgi:phenylalanyl-tRNA synthetase beta chain
LIHHLLEVLKYNNARSIANVHIFELSHRTVLKAGIPHQSLLLSGAMTGTIHETKWLDKVEGVDFYYIKGVVEAVFEYLNVMEQIRFVQVEQNFNLTFHEGRTAHILYNNQLVGIIGQIHPIAEEEYDLNQTFVFEIELDLLLESTHLEKQYAPISKYPQMIRDLAIVVNQTIPVEQLIQSIWQAGGEFLKAVDIFDAYEGEHVAKGKKSLAFSLVFALLERTLTDEEVNFACTAILSQLELKFEAELRQ